MIVVAAGIVAREGKILLCRRKPGGAQSLKWEFPGGKLERGESPERALERELREELGVETRTGRIFDAHYHADGDRELLILFYHSRLLSGEPQPIDCTAAEWVAPAALTDYDLAPADRSVTVRLAEASRQNG